MSNGALKPRHISAITWLEFHLTGKVEGPSLPWNVSKARGSQHVIQYQFCTCCIRFLNMLVIIKTPVFLRQKKVALQHCFIALILVIMIIPTLWRCVSWLGVASTSWVISGSQTRASLDNKQQTGRGPYQMLASPQGRVRHERRVLWRRQALLMMSNHNNGYRCE